MNFYCKTICPREQEIPNHHQFTESLPQGVALELVSSFLRHLMNCCSPCYLQEFEGFEYSNYLIGAGSPTTTRDATEDLRELKD